MTVEGVRSISRIRISGVETRIRAFDDVPRATIVDPPAIVFTKNHPGLALRIPNDLLPIGAGQGNGEGPL
jgi:hypothetical protein